MAKSQQEWDNWDIVLEEELKLYSKEIADKISKEAKRQSRKLTQLIKEDAPEKTGEYKSNWHSKLMWSGATGVRYRVLNVKKWQLTHLLEYGHIDEKTGGRVRAFPHISNNAKKIVSEFEKNVLEIIKNTK